MGKLECLFEGYCYGKDKVYMGGESELIVLRNEFKVV